MHSPLKRDQAGSIPASPTKFAGLADMDMHSPFKRDEVGSIPVSHPSFSIGYRLCALFALRLPFHWGMAFAENLDVASRKSSPTASP